MAVLTIAGKSVTRGRVRVPRQGAWHVEAWLDADTAPIGAAALVWGDKAAAWQGTLVPALSGVYVTGGPAQVRVVGGAGGLQTALPGASYRNVSARVILGQILAAAGERLSGASPAATLDPILARWSRAAGTAAAQVGRLSEALGVLWRVLPDGSVYVGPEPGGTLTLGKDDAVVERLPGESRLTLATAAPWALTVGQAFEGAAIDEIIHTLGPDKTRSDLWRAA